MISQALASQESILKGTWDRATPFRHLVIDGFFDTDKCRELLDAFPRFDDQNALNEFGEVGGKAVVEDLDALSNVYADLNAFLRSDGFLALISRLTGIQDLLPDPAQYGGGTHENREGQELDPHVDYNYIHGGKLHRRLNLIVYLNEEWSDDWGGALEIHSDPWEPESNQIKLITPLFNRAVIFETNEYSWHGFSKICLPADKKHISRKSIAIYLYTKTRPEEEVTPSHGTFYVQRPLPPTIAPGKVLDETDVNELKSLLKRRDDWIRFYQQREIEFSARLMSSPAQVQWWVDRIYRWTPVSPATKTAVGHFLFRYFGFVFKNTRSYKTWANTRK